MTQEIRRGRLGVGRRRPGRTWAAGLGLALALTGTAFALGAGGLDASFGGDGIVQFLPGELAYDASGFGRNPQAHAADAASRIVVVGSAGKSGYKSRWFAVRLSEDGSLDPAFGSAGQTTLFGAGPGDDRATAVALDAAGRIYLAGRRSRSIKVGKKTLTEWNPTVVRLDAGGVLDTGWGQGGVAAIQTVGTLNGSVRLALEADGRVLVSGDVVANGKGGLAFFAARLTAAGVMDSAYGDGGLIKYELPGGVISVDGLSLDGGGRAFCLVRGQPVSGSSRFSLLRLTAEGGLDPTFPLRDLASVVAGANVGLTFGGAYGLAVQADGSPVVSLTCPVNDASGPGDAVLLRFTPTASVDTGFGSSGLARSYLSGSDSGLGVLVRPDGTLIWSCVRTAAPQTVLHAQVLPTGTLDAGYGTGGWSATVAANGNGSPCLDPSGRVIQQCGQIFIRYGAD